MEVQHHIDNIVCDFDENQAYRCRMCRIEIFKSSQVLQHHGDQNKPFKSSEEMEVCTSVFTKEPIEIKWLEMMISNQGDCVQGGKIVCPGCSCKLGYWSWTGTRCSCNISTFICYFLIIISGGVWVVPSFQFQLQKIDFDGDSSD